MKMMLLASVAGIVLIVVGTTVLFCVERPKADPIRLEIGGSDPVRVEMGKLSGTWQMVSGENEGATARDARKYKFILTADGHYTTREADKALSAGAFLLDVGRTPKTIDFNAAEGTLSGRTLRCVYDLKGDELRFCFCVSGTDRPEDFDAGPGTGHVLMVYERVRAN